MNTTNNKFFDLPSWLKSESISPDLQKNYFHVLNANNGAGKTNYISNICKNIIQKHHTTKKSSKNPKYSNLICISNTAFDKFVTYHIYQNWLETIDTTYLTQKIEETSKLLETLKSNSDEYKKTKSEFDKLSNKLNKSKLFFENNRYIRFYFYTGYTTQNNLSTVVIPFRTLFDILSNTNSYCYSIEWFEWFKSKNKSLKLKVIKSWQARFDLLKENLQELNFSEKFIITLKKKKDRTVINNKERSFDLSSKYIIKNFRKFLKDLYEDNLEVSNIYFEKDNNRLSLSELSSGEYIFLRALFVLCLSVKKNSLILYDEPENSLHPEWQSKFMEMMTDIVKTLGKNQATVVIATHSPLITSSIDYNKVKYSTYANPNNPREFHWDTENLYGWDNKTILKKQFGLPSARSVKFTKEINEILKQYQNNDEEWVNEILKLEKSVQLNPEDQLNELFTLLLEIAKEKKQG